VLLDPPKDGLRGTPEMLDELEVAPEGVVVGLSVVPTPVVVGVVVVVDGGLSVGVGAAGAARLGTEASGAVRGSNRCGTAVCVVWSAFAEPRTVPLVAWAAVPGTALTREPSGEMTTGVPDVPLITPVLPVLPVLVVPVVPPERVPPAPAKPDDGTTDPLAPVAVPPPAAIDPPPTAGAGPVAATVPPPAATAPPLADGAGVATASGKSIATMRSMLATPGSTELELEPSEPAELPPTAPEGCS
jgi:hypothetical protein